MKGEATPAGKLAAPRLLPLDALRGFAMFWIVGVEEIVHALHKIRPTGFPNFLATQLDHQAWAARSRRLAETMQKCW